MPESCGHGVAIVRLLPDSKRSATTQLAQRRIAGISPDYWRRWPRATPYASAAPTATFSGVLVALVAVSSFPLTAESLHSESRGQGIPGLNRQSVSEIKRIIGTSNVHGRRPLDAATSVSVAVNGRSAATMLSSRHSQGVVKASVGRNDASLRAPIEQAVSIGSNESLGALPAVIHKAAASPTAKWNGTEPTTAPPATPAATLLAFNLSKSIQSTMIHPVVANDSAVIQGPPSAAVRDNESLVASDDLDGNVSDGQNGVTTGMLLELHGTRDVESQSPVLVARLGAASLAGALTALRLDAQSGSGLNSLLIVLVCLTALILSAAAIFVLVTNHRFSLTQLRTEIMNRAFPPPVSPVVATPSPSPRPQPQRFVVAESASSEEPLSQISETTEHFAARLEEIIEQLSQMLKGTMRTYPKSTADTGGTDARTWWYVAALPGSTTSQTTISHGLVKWSSGRLGWWPNIDAFHANDSPIGSVPLGKITGITNEDADPTVVVVVAESEPDRIFQFQTWKEAKTWASTLAALIEQLHDEN